MLNYPYKLANKTTGTVSDGDDPVELWPSASGGTSCNREGILIRNRANNGDGAILVLAYDDNGEVDIDEDLVQRVFPGQAYFGEQGSGQRLALATADGSGLAYTAWERIKNG